VEEVAREFQLDEIAPIAGAGSSSGGDGASTQALLENLDELLGRLRRASPLPSRERKS
jgi:hypothetical protein